jgi:hypothetical protein
MVCIRGQESAPADLLNSQHSLGMGSTRAPSCSGPNSAMYWVEVVSAGTPVTAAPTAPGALTSADPLGGTCLCKAQSQPACQGGGFVATHVAQPS